MAEEWDRRTLVADGFTQVLAELSWLGGPCAGLADVDGTPHYYALDEDPPWEYRRYLVWPAPDGAAALERELWRIFARWDALDRSGRAAPGGHPGAGGVDPRYDELEALLAPHRAPARGARRLYAEWRFDGGDRYREDGTDSWVRWS